MQFRVAALVALLVLAGCVTPFDAGEVQPVSEAADGDTGETGDRVTGENAVAGPTETRAGASDPGPGEGGTSASRRANPWESETLTVAAINTAGTWRNLTGHIVDAVDYWEAHPEYGSYDVDFDLRPNARDPDVVVRYVEDIAACGSASGERGAGFAPRISEANRPEPPEFICVGAGYTEASTRRIVRHEFGHLLGIRHGEPPTDLMRPDYPLFQVPRPGATVQATAFEGRNLSVFVDRSTVYARRNVVAKRQLETTIAFYERASWEALALPASVTEVEDRDAADVVVTFPRQSPCERTQPGSCAHIETAPGGDSQLVVAITSTHEDEFGWHAGFWLGIALGADRHRDLPPPFRNASADDRHGEWWNGGARDRGSPATAASACQTGLSSCSVARSFHTFEPHPGWDHTRRALNQQPEYIQAVPGE